MKIMLIVLLLPFHFIYGASIYGKIQALSLGEYDEDHLIKLESGRVIFIQNHQFEELNKIKKNRVYKFIVDQSNYLLRAYPFAANHKMFKSVKRKRLMPKPFEPTILKTTQQAKNIFLRMRRNYTRSGQCFNRAHVWSYEEFVKYKTKLQKLFLFFTDRYIRLYRFHWWFHVAPLTYVGNLSRVLDRRYTQGPLQIKTWTDIFIKSKYTCPLIQNFSEYSLNQEKKHCYLYKSSMYQVVPRDLEKLELYGDGKEFFSKIELNMAYKDAFLSNFL